MLEDPGKAEEGEEFAWDDVNNIALPLQLVRKARQEEMRCMKGKIFKVVKKSEAWRLTGKAPISTKWVDTDKTNGTGEPMVRSRWVARDFKDPKEKDREDLFSATPAIRDDEIHYVEAGHPQERWLEKGKPCSST